LFPQTCQDSELVAQEINTWEKNFIDLEKMKKSAEDSKQENLSLREKIALLERKIQVSSRKIKVKSKCSKDQPISG
jgi:hypothetical protein